MRGAAVLLSCLLLGCGGDTTLRVDVTLAPGEWAPPALLVSAFSPTREITPPRRLAPAPLPGSFILRGLPGVDQLVRVVVAAEGGKPPLGGAFAQVRAGREASAAVMLASATLDDDGDGIPDAFDNCPALANATQADADANGAGGGPDGDAGGGGVRPGGPSLCPVLGALECQPFELPIAAPWFSNLTGGSSGRDTTRSFRGASAFHLHTEGATAPALAAAEVARDGLPSSGSVFVRAFFYAEALPPAYTRILTIQQPKAPWHAISAIVNVDGSLTLANSVSGMRRFSPSKAPLGRWFCLELEVQPGAPGTTRLFLDDAELPGLTRSEDTSDAPALSDVIFGIYLADYMSMIGPWDLWVDEVAYGSQRIGCAR